jgi:peptidyl-prolyl cis-trans isomerase A (cyclophilin A)
MQDIRIILKTNKGNIEATLFAGKVPMTSANFLNLAKRGYYDGIKFHRVIPDFMIQGGDPQGTGMGGPGYQFEDETKGSPHRFDKAGKLAMANAGPNTNGSQFFITVANTEWLTGKHTIFGEVVEGHDVVEKVSKVPRNRQDRPNKDVVVESVTIERA